MTMVVDGAAVDKDIGQDVIGGAVGTPQAEDGTADLWEVEVPAVTPTDDIRLGTPDPSAVDHEGIEHIGSAAATQGGAVHRARFGREGRTVAVTVVHERVPILPKHFSGRIAWPITPFVGTLGVAPDREVTTSIDGQGDWGGNLDIRDVAPGK